MKTSSHPNPLAYLPELPRTATRRMFLGRDQDFIAGVQRDPDALEVERLRRVSREREFVRPHGEQVGESGHDVFRDPGAQVRPAADGKLGHGPIARGDRIHDLPRRHADARVVQVGRAGFDQEVRADVFPVRVVRPGRGPERREFRRRRVPLPGGAGGEAEGGGSGRPEPQPLPPVQQAMEIVSGVRPGHGQQAELRVNDIELPLGKRSVNASPSISTPVGSSGPSPSRAVIASGLAGRPAIVRPYER